MVGVGVADADFAEQADAFGVVVRDGRHPGAQGAPGVPGEVVEAYAGPFAAVEVGPGVALPAGEAAVAFAAAGFDADGAARGGARTQRAEVPHAHHPGDMGAPTR